MTITYGTIGSETEEEARERFWSPSCKYADELLAEKQKRNRSADLKGRSNGKHSDC